MMTLQRLRRSTTKTAFRRWAWSGGADGDVVGGPGIPCLGLGEDRGRCPCSWDAEPEMLPRGSEEGGEVWRSLVIADAGCEVVSGGDRVELWTACSVLVRPGWLHPS